MGQAAVFGCCALGPQIIWGIVPCKHNHVGNAHCGQTANSRLHAPTADHFGQTVPCKHNHADKLSTVDKQLNSAATRSDNKALWTKRCKSATRHNVEIRQFAEFEPCVRER